METIKLNKKELETSFNEVYELYANSIYRFCMSRLSCNEESAEDCTQETFLVFYRRLKSGESFENPRAFLYRTAYNFVRKKYDEIKARTDNEIDFEKVDYTVSNAVQTENNYDDKELLNRLESVLTDEERLLYTKRFVQEQRVSDIAAQLNITPQNCSVKLHRLKNKLKSEFEKYMKG